MKELKLIVEISKPAKDVFAFTLNPQNTPKWIDSFMVEQTNEWPPKLGTIYRNQNKAGKWQVLELTSFEPDKMFVMSKKDGYHVRYTFTPVKDDTTRLEYYEWVDSGELKDSLTPDVLQKLKQVIEAE